MVILSAAMLWSRYRPAQRFQFSELSAQEFRVVTWNVGYFALASNKNVRPCDLASISATS